MERRASRMLTRAALFGAALGLGLACHAAIGGNHTSTGPSDASTDAITSATTPPTIPVGFDAYRQWDRLPYVRLGTRTYMRSTYDRSGGNEAADASHYLREGERRDDLRPGAGRRPCGARVSW
jgi:hypothetical protein